MTKKQSLILKDITDKKIHSFSDLFESLDLISFNGSISLQEYQVAALQKALCSLKLYRDDTKELCYEYKQAFKYNAIKLDSKKGLDIKEFCNMASFWMATGSGKSIVMIKLISLMQKLMKSGEIESKPIMLLVPNDKILHQFKTHIQSFNAYQPIQITCKEIKAYDNQSLLGFENVVFLGRSDLLDIKENVGKDSKAKRLNYDDLMREKGWYILLDEAHKGDSKDSIRKSYIRDLAKGRERQEYPHGFIFNFSATFDNDIELFTCAFNYNLEKFNNDGYGKNIVVLDSNLKAFKDSKVDSSDEKLERILESFILFVGIKQELKSLKARFENLHYHNPLIIAVADKVNTKDAGIKLYFEAIMKILQDSKDISEIAKNLAKKLESSNIYFAEKEMNKDFLERLAKVDSRDLREQIFYAKETSSLECCKIKGNNKELAFKSKNATKPFLLLNIGSIKEWEKSYLDGLGIESGEDMAKGYFEELNHRESPIQIMMGSKVFSEGWDSNRVNFINFINIGSKKAKKYVLQTIGRGVRIEPFKDVRKRLKASNTLEYNTKDSLGDGSLGIESVFIMATENEAIEWILKGLEGFRFQSKLTGFKRNKTLEPLLVPSYKNSHKSNETFVISHYDFERLSKYIESYDEDILLVSSGINRVDLGFSTLQKIQQKMRDEASVSLEIKGNMPKLKPQNALHSMDRFFHTPLLELEKFVPCEDSITHFKDFMLSGDGLSEMIIKEMNKAVKELAQSKQAKSIDALKKEFEKGKISLDEYTEQIQAKPTQRVEKHSYVITAELAKHYYSPMVLESYKDSTIHINYAVSERSEIEFLEDLQKYLQDSKNAFKDYEWCFSKIVEKLDSIFIPYFDTQSQEQRKFYPDFIFWLKHKQSGNYKIIFVDPKGLSFEANARDKLQGFKELFCDKKLDFQGLGIEVDLYYYNKESSVPKDFEGHIAAQICELFFKRSNKDF